MASGRRWPCAVRPVLRNRSAFAYSLAYCVHTLEMSAPRGWGVAFLTWVAASTGRAAGAADPARRGATLAVHSMLGYAGGFVGPLVIGWTLDLSGGMSPIGWGLAFGIIAAIMAPALGAFIAIRPNELEGDRCR